MKKLIINSALMVVLSGTLTSCFTQTYVVGNGPQKGIETIEKSHYLVYGLAPVKTADPVKMAGDAKDYSVTIQHSFVDGLLNAITFGLYTPTTTKVVK
ncbi:MAG: Bor family protein [Algoriphagus aquaeductus]|uniref:Bor protein n=1 Tax=Algoriphagus aquaeductus TaxID=475299 RepID=A0A326RKQ0_9BACT|nr:Bor family protein [Algoriphagus aquaeductus]PZV76720.1 Bor protein [Algoriphagus aquaeductus]